LPTAGVALRLTGRSPARRDGACGRDLVDIGAESTRPGADPLPVDEELGRLVPVLEGLRGG
jgi:dihydropteroate synthase